MALPTKNYRINVAGGEMLVQFSPYYDTIVTVDFTVFNISTSSVEAILQLIGAVRDYLLQHRAGYFRAKTSLDMQTLTGRLNDEKISSKILTCYPNGKPLAANEHLVQITYLDDQET